MSDDIKIQLDGTTPEKYCAGGLKKQLFFVFMTAFVIWALFRVIITRDTTSLIKPPDSSFSLRIIKTASTSTQIHNNLGSKTLIYGAPWRFDDLLTWASREYTLHFDENGNVIGFNFDNTIDQTKIQSIIAADYFVISSNSMTIVSETEISKAEQKILFHPFRALNPWYDGDIYSQNSSNYITISNKKMRLHGIGFKPDSEFRLDAPENTDISAYFSFDSASLNSIVNKVFDNPIYSNTFSNALFSNTHILLGQDAKGLVYVIRSNNTGTDTKVLAQLAQDLLKPFNLSTLALTMGDGSIAQEIRSSSDTFTSSISSDAGAQFLIAKDNQQNQIFITKTEQFLMITNRESVLTSAKYQVSSCQKSAHSMLKPTQLFSLQKSTVQNDWPKQTPLFFQFPEIAITNSDIVFCWE